MFKYIFFFKFDFWRFELNPPSYYDVKKGG